MSKDREWIWMPHAAHLCVSSRCQFRLATYVNGVIVSTIGEYQLAGYERGWEPIGRDRLYETMVFKARPTTQDECDACPYQAANVDSLDMDSYNTAKDAYAGHMALCRKWATQEAPWT